jgi:hypothetical protein
MVENWPAECAGGPGAINTKIAEEKPTTDGHGWTQRGKAATKLIRTHELMKMERGISRKTGNTGTDSMFNIQIQYPIFK